MKILVALNLKKNDINNMQVLICSTIQPPEYTKFFKSNHWWITICFGGHKVYKLRLYVYGNKPPKKALRERIKDVLFKRRKLDIEIFKCDRYVVPTGNFQSAINIPEKRLKLDILGFIKFVLS